MALAATLAACDKALPGWNDSTDTTPVGPDGTSAFSLRIQPVITKVTDLNFEEGDAIGVTVTRASGVYAANQKLTYAGTEFSGNLNWYLEPDDEAAILAYYPYAETVPTSFTVQTDQSAGTAASDFVVGAKAGLKPSAQAVVIPFKHMLTKVNIALNNQSGKDIEGVTLEGAIPTAILDASFNVTADENAQPVAIKAGKAADNQYALILPPQTATLTAVVTVSGGQELSQKLAQATLVGGKAYDLSIVVLSNELKVVLSGELANWGEGGDLKPEDPGDDPGENPEYAEWAEHLDAAQPYFEYHKVKYNVVKMKDGKWWMAQNLAYLPEGLTPAADLTAVTAGVFYPIKVNEEKVPEGNDDNPAAEFDVTEEAVAAKGMLYQAEVALGLHVGALTTVEEAQALEGAQGICPEGWHVPTIQDIMDLVGKSVGQSDKSSAPYYVNGIGSMQALNADGFQVEAYGAITIQNNTQTVGKFMGWNYKTPNEPYKYRISSGMFCGSSYASVTYAKDENGQPTTVISNLQFYGFMPMTNKATEAEYTFNGTKVNYRIAAPLRCVRNPEQ